MDLDIKSIATSLTEIANCISALYHIEDEISKLADDVRDLNTSIDYLTDKIGELNDKSNS